MPADIHRWTELPVDHPRPLIDRRRIIGDNMMVSEVFLHKGFRLETHQHANEQFGVVLSGRIRFGLGAEGSPERREATLAGGQVIRFPANFPHSAEALEDTLILDLFSPPSEGTGVDQKR
ncbi:MAG: cupin domain-containing protein [Phycisphaerales bacterium]|nr:cupin domain-containing protein [Phycisphaerales bacterium]